MRSLLFSSFLDDDEKILDVAHRHPLVLKIESFKTFSFGIVLPTVLYLIFPQAFAFYLLWWAVGLIGMIYHFWDWYFDAWIITDQGVIDIERKGLWNVSATRVEHYNIESIGWEMNGVLQTIFRYGDIVLDKMGSNTHIVLKDASNPKKLERKILRYQEKYVRHRSVKDHNMLKNMLSDMIAYHIQNDKISNPYKDEE